MKQATISAVKTAAPLKPRIVQGKLNRRVAISAVKTAAPLKLDAEDLAGSELRTISAVKTAAPLKRKLLGPPLLPIHLHLRGEDRGPVEASVGASRPGEP